MANVASRHQVKILFIRRKLLEIKIGGLKDGGETG